MSDSERIQIDYLKKLSYNNIDQIIIGATDSLQRENNLETPDYYIGKKGIAYQIKSVSAMSLSTAQGDASNKAKWEIYGVDTDGNHTLLGTYTDDGTATFSAGSTLIDSCSHCYVKLTPLGGLYDMSGTLTLDITTDVDTGGYSFAVANEYLDSNDSIYIHLSWTGSTYYGIDGDDTTWLYGGRRHTPDGSERKPYLNIPDFSSNDVCYQIQDSENYEANEISVYTDDQHIQSKTGEKPVIAYGIGARDTRNPNGVYNNNNACFFNENGDNSSGNGKWGNPFRTLSRANGEANKNGRSGFITVVYGGYGATTNGYVYADFQFNSFTGYDIDSDYKYIPQLDLINNTTGGISCNFPFSGFYVISSGSIFSATSVNVKDCTFFSFSSDVKSNEFTRCYFINCNSIESEKYLYCKVEDGGNILCDGTEIDNSIFMNCNKITMESGDITNSIFSNCDTGVYKNDSGTLNIDYCIFYNCTNYGINLTETGDLAGGIINSDYCCFYGNGTNYSNYVTVTNEVESDPLFDDPDNGKFGLDYNSPCFEDDIGLITQMFKNASRVTPLKIVGVYLNGNDICSYVSINCQSYKIYNCDVYSFLNTFNIYYNQSSGSDIDDLTVIENTKIYNNGATFGRIEGKNSDNPKIVYNIENNIFYNNKFASRINSSSVGGFYFSDGFSSNLIKNNVFYNNGGCIELLEIEYHTGVYAEITNNIFFNNNDFDVKSEEVIVILKYNCLNGIVNSNVNTDDSSNIIGDPFFVDPDNNDFHIKTIEGGYGIDSPCKGSGLDGVDMGAYVVNRDVTESQYRVLRLTYNPFQMNEVEVTKGHQLYEDVFGDIRPRGEGTLRKFPFEFSVNQQANETDRKTLAFIRSIVSGSKMIIDSEEVRVKDYHMHCRLHFLPSGKELTGTGATLNGSILTDSTKSLEPDEYRGFYLSLFSASDSSGCVTYSSSKIATISGLSNVAEDDFKDQYLCLFLNNKIYYFYILSNTASGGSLGLQLTLSDPLNYLTDETDIEYIICQNYKILGNSMDGSFKLYDPDNTLVNGTYDYHIDFIKVRSLSSQSTYNQYIALRKREQTKRGYSITFEEVRR